MQETQEMGVHPWVGKTPLEKEMAIHSSILGWRILWTEERQRVSTTEQLSRHARKSEIRRLLIIGMRLGWDKTENPLFPYYCCE